MARLQAAQKRAADDAAAAHETSGVAVQPSDGAARLAPRPKVARRRPQLRAVPMAAAAAGPSVAVVPCPQSSDQGCEGALGKRSVQQRADQPQQELVANDVAGAHNGASCAHGEASSQAGTTANTVAPANQMQALLGGYADDSDDSSEEAPD